MKKKFEIVDYNPAWKEKFLNEKEKLFEIFGDNLHSIHHIGSTAIPNTKAKPEIDILIVIKDVSILSKHDRLIVKLGYRVRGECLESGGTPGRFYYSKDIDNRRTHKLHVCQIGHSEILSKLLFVKYLNDHKATAEEYSRIKTSLSKRYNYGSNFEKYISGKSDFVMDVLERARKENKDIRLEDFS